METSAGCESRLERDVLGATSGDTDCAARLIREHTGLVFTLIRRIVGNRDAAMDLTQDCFIRAIDRIGSLRDPRSFRSWLTVMARRMALDHLRRHHREVPVDPSVLESAAADEPPVGEIDMRSRKRRLLETAIGSLDERDRSLLTLFYFEELGGAEVAEALQIPLSNVRVYLHRARKRLRERLRGHEQELLD